MKLVRDQSAEGLAAARARAVAAVGDQAGEAAAAFRATIIAIRLANRKNLAGKFARDAHTCLERRRRDSKSAFHARTRQVLLTLYNVVRSPCVRGFSVCRRNFLDDLLLDHATSTRFHHIKTPVINKAIGISPKKVQTSLSVSDGNLPKCSLASQDKNWSPRRRSRECDGSKSSIKP